VGDPYVPVSAPLSATDELQLQYRANQIVVSLGWSGHPEWINIHGPRCETCADRRGDQFLLEFGATHRELNRKHPNMGRLRARFRNAWAAFHRLYPHG
jgi:hypothetical protein